MSEKLEKHSGRSQALILEELAQLRQVRVENNTLASLNMMYKEQVKNLEVEISDLKALVMAREYEMRLVHEKYSKPVSSCSGCKENSVKTEKDEEVNKLKLLLEKEILENKQLVHKVKELEVYIKSLEQNHSLDLDSTVETTAPCNAPRMFTSNFRVDPHVTFGEPRSEQIPAAKKSVTPARIVKHFTCNLSEILSPSPLRSQPAEFCPSILRKFKGGSSFNKFIN